MDTANKIRRLEITEEENVAHGDTAGLMSSAVPEQIDAPSTRAWIWLMIVKRSRTIKVSQRFGMWSDC